MLPRASRLPSYDIASLRRKGRRIPVDGLDISYREHVSTARFAVIVPIRVDKRATARNRIKRLIHESLFLLTPRLRPVDCVIFVKKKLPDTQKQVQTLIEDVFAKASLFLP